ncbi:MAG: hypothetical protein U1F17_00895 [Burkholderiaceae bacterium]
MAVHHERATSARWSRWAGALASVSIALDGRPCGGTDLAGVGSGGTGISVASVSYGSISLRLGDRQRRALRRTAPPPCPTTTARLDPLGLGMVIEVRGDIDSTGLAGNGWTRSRSSARRAARSPTCRPAASMCSAWTVRTTVNTVYDEALLRS